MNFEALRLPYGEVKTRPTHWPVAQDYDLGSWEENESREDQKQNQAGPMTL